MRRQIPQLHVLGHPLSKNGHVKLLCDTKALQAAPPRCRKRTSSGISEDQIMVPRLPRVTTAQRFSPTRPIPDGELCRAVLGRRVILPLPSSQYATGVSLPFGIVWPSQPIEEGGRRSLLRRK